MFECLLAMRSSMRGWEVHCSAIGRDELRNPQNRILSHSACVRKCAKRRWTALKSNHISCVRNWAASDFLFHCSSWCRVFCSFYCRFTFFFVFIFMANHVGHENGDFSTAFCFFFFGDQSMACLLLCKAALLTWPSRFTRRACVETIKIKNEIASIHLTAIGLDCTTRRWLKFTSIANFCARRFPVFVVACTRRRSALFPSSDGIVTGT